MGQVRRIFAVLVATLVLATVFTVPASARTVTPGAFCAQADSGSFGRTTNGVLMRCTTTSSDSRLRWRAHGSPFTDTRGNAHEANIERLADRGVTRGCDSSNLRFCPRDEVTRQQMAAFVVRSLSLVDGNHPGFRDVPNGSTFDRDIRRLARAGITLGCNPPANDRFCPGDPVTREQMAAFLSRALGLPASDRSAFRDVAVGSTFEADVRRLAQAGITRGCNPPANDRFCPRDHVTRDQMASFLVRGFG